MKSQALEELILSVLGADACMRDYLGFLTRGIREGGGSEQQGIRNLDKELVVEVANY